MKKEAQEERSHSGIPGFDSICEGGLVQNSVNVIIGGPGAGKTTLLMQYLHEGAVKYHENGLFISLEPELTGLYKDALAHDWNFEKLGMQNKIFFIKIPPTASTLEIKGDIVNLILKNTIKRVCFDPASLFAALVSNEMKMREDIYELMTIFKKAGVTILLSAEAHVGDEAHYSYNIRLEYLKSLADAVIELYSSGLGGVSDRAIRIIKMRRTNHQRGPIPFEISESGVKVLFKKSK